MSCDYPLVPQIMCVTQASFMCSAAAGTRPDGSAAASTNWENLNRYADEFRTSESGGTGPAARRRPVVRDNDEALVENLDLDYEVVYAGSEPALIQAFRQADANRDWVTGYFYEPQ